MSRVQVRGRLQPSWGGHSIAVRVHDELKLLRWRATNGIATKLFYEKDEHGKNRPSVYVGKRAAAAVKPGDLVSLVLATRDTAMGTRIKTVSVEMALD